MIKIFRIKLTVLENIPKILHNTNSDALDGNLGGHTAHGMDASSVASLDEQFDVRAQEVFVHTNLQRHMGEFGVEFDIPCWLTSLPRCDAWAQEVFVQ